MHLENDLTRAIRTKAKELGLNQAQLAKRIGVVQSAMVLVLRGMSQPNRKTIPKYAHFLGMNPRQVEAMIGRQAPKTKLGQDGAKASLAAVHVANRTMGEVLALAEDELAWVVHRAPKEVRALLQTVFSVGG